MRTGDRGKIVMMRRRPNDLLLGQISWRLIFGVFGVHNFYTGRRIRGWIMLGCMLAFVLEVLVFPLGDITNALEGIHPWREALGDGGLWPFDVFGIIPVVMWISDVVSIMLGWYKYPVRLGEVGDAAKVWVR